MKELGVCLLTMQCHASTICIKLASYNLKSHTTHIYYNVKDVVPGGLHYIEQELGRTV